MKRIMTVDDSATIRQMVALTLRDAGYEVVEAIDGRDALERLSQESVDMLITDLNMPNLDGVGLIRAVRQDPANRFIPIIMLTTESHDSKKQEGKAAGASGWIVKPFKPEQLLGVVKMVLV
ncbi:MAG: response regulator [Desulfuromonadales bacterium]|nr:response regulator [Desulfuromonadales bacterium]